MKSSRQFNIALLLIAFVLFILLLPTTSTIASTYNETTQTITDANGFEYRIISDGMYEVSYGSGQTTKFGFGMTGTYNGQPFRKMSTDFAWQPTAPAPVMGGYNFSTRTTTTNFINAWYTNVSFTDKTKITNRITNTLPLSITNGKFYYLIELNETEEPSIIWDAADPGNFSNLTIHDNIRVVLNDRFEFNLYDLLQNGFVITDITTLNASVLGFNSTKRVVAIGFTKGVGTLPSGATVLIDPSIGNKQNRAKMYDDTSKTLNLTTSSNQWSIRQVSVAPDLVTMEEVFEVTNLNGNQRPITPTDFSGRASANGKAITGVEWKYLNNNSMWVDFPSVIPTNPGESILIKAIFHKKAETGAIQIQTIPKFMGVEEENMTWWSGGWNYSIHNAIADGDRPYQIELNISNSTGTNNATHVFVTCQALNCSDLRFTLDNTTTLPYWFHTNTSNTSAAVWGRVYVNVTANGVVNMYYGSTTAVWSSSGASTFKFFDDFEDGNTVGWSVQANTAISTTQKIGSYAVELNDGSASVGQFGYLLNQSFNYQSGFLDYDIYKIESGYLATDFQTAVGADVFRNIIHNAAPWGMQYLNTVPAWADYSNGAFAHPTNKWVRHSFKFNATVPYLDAKVNDTYLGTGGKTADGTIAWLMFESGSSSYSGIYGYIDNIRVKHWVTTVPVWATWGSQTTILTPPTPTGITATSGLWWINTTWTNGTGNYTELYNVSVNGTWYNKTSATFFNSTGLSPLGYSNVIVYGYTSGGNGNQSTTAATLNTQLFTNNFSSAIADGQRPFQVSVNITNQSGTSNATHLFLNGTCAQTNCTDLAFSTPNATAQHWVDWNNTVNISNTLWATVWVNLTENGTVNAYTGNPTIIRNNTAGGLATFQFFDDFITDRFTDVGTQAYVDTTSQRLLGMGYRGGIVHRSDYDLTSISDTAWRLDFDIITTDAVGGNGIEDFGIFSIPESRYGATGDAIFLTTAVNTAIIGSRSMDAGSATGGGTLTTVGNTQYYITMARTSATSVTTYIYKDQKRTLQLTGSPTTQTVSAGVTGLRYLQISNYHDNTASGDYNTNYVDNTRLVSYSASPPIFATWTPFTPPEAPASTFIPPVPSLGTTTTGNFWVRHDWSAGSGNITNSYNVNINGSWVNGSSATFFNSTGLSEHVWANISVYAYNSSGSTTSLTAASENKQVPNNIPTTPQITSPISNTKGANHSFTGTWSTSTDLDTGDSVTYHYQVSTLPGFSTIFNESNLSATTTGLITGLVNSTTYYVRVRSNDTRDYSPWSTTILVNENTKPSILNESIETTSLYVYNTNTITAYFRFDTDVNNVVVRVMDYASIEENFTMTCSNGTTPVCIYNYRKDGDENAGSYAVIRYYFTDNYKASNSTASILTFTYLKLVDGGGYDPPPEPKPTTTPSGGVGGGGGGGGIVPETPTDITKALTFINITEGAITPDAEAIARCMTESLIMRNECSNFYYGTVIDPFNWWVIIGGFISAFGVVFAKGILEDKPRQWFTEPILYGVITTISIFLMVYIGFNMYFFNYLMESPKYFWTFISFMFWGVIFAMAGDYYYYTYKKLKYKLNLP